MISVPTGSSFTVFVPIEISISLAEYDPRYCSFSFTGL
jgi:hypothetical protein